MNVALREAQIDESMEKDEAPASAPVVKPRARKTSAKPKPEAATEKPKKPAKPKAHEHGGRKPTEAPVQMKSHKKVEEDEEDPWAEQKAKFGDYEFKGIWKDMDQNVEPDDVNYVRAQISRHVINNQMAGYILVKDQGNVDVREWVLFDDDIEDGVQPTRELQSYGKASDLKAWFANKLVFYPKVVKGRKKSEVDWVERNPYDVWMEAVDRPEYGRVSFKPWKWGCEEQVQKSLPDGTLNLFQGWKRTPIFDNPEGCRLLLNHIFNVLCDGDVDYFTYFISWFAHKVQKPHIKIKTAISFKSVQGVGKGIFLVGVIGEIFGSHFKHLTSVEALTGHFSTGFQDALFIFLDEAFFTRDMGAAQQLKTLITEDKARDRAMYKNTVWRKAFFDLLFATNLDLAAILDPSDRRYSISAVKMKKAPPPSYFDAMLEEMANGGIESFFGFLLQWQTPSHVNIHKPFESVARTETKMASLRDLDAWWYEVLKTGTFGETSNGRRVDWHAVEGKEVPRALMPDSYRDWATVNRKAFRETTDAISKRVTTLCPSLAKGVSGHPKPITEAMWDKMGAKRQRIYRVPRLEDARAEFETAMEGKVQWDDNAEATVNLNTPAPLKPAGQKEPPL